MNVWPGWIATIMVVKKDPKFKTRIASSGGRFFLAGSGYKAQTWHNDMRYRRGKCTENFMITNWTRKTFMRVQALITIFSRKKMKSVCQGLLR